MSFLPLSRSTTSLSSTNSACFTDISDSTGYTSDGRCDSIRCVKGNSSVRDSEDEMGKFLLGPGWHDHRVPPAERLKHLYRLLEEHYDLTGGDYHGESTLHVWATSSSSRRSMRLEEYPIACMSYLTSIGADLDFLEDLDDMSQDPMNDLIDEAFRHPISISPILKDRTIPTSTWAIDWSRPLPSTTHAYWEMMHRTRPKPVHEFTRAKPVVVAPRVILQPHRRQEDFPQYYDAENVNTTSRKLRAALYKVRELVTSY